MQLPREVREALVQQSGVVSRRQVVGAGMVDSDVRRLLRRREWAVVHPGVYVGHTGPLTWTQRAWAAVLYAWPAALAHESALRTVDGPGRREQPPLVVHVVVDQRRTVRSRAGVRIHRRRNLEEFVHWNTSPPRLRIEEAVIDVSLDASDDLAAISALARAVGSRSTTPRRLLDSVSRRARVPRRRWLTAVLEDIAEGTCSVLEHEYLVRIERAHGLPRGVRQKRAEAPTGVAYRDVSYEGVAPLVVELDGRLFHDSAGQRDRDFERDLNAALDGMATIRLSWGQVHDRPCQTAMKVGELLRRHGWRGQVARCGDRCPVGPGGFAVAS
ncbi:MAG: hypothetical protein ACTHNS_14890 [Marmoricola sp.]